MYNKEYKIGQKVYFKNPFVIEEGKVVDKWTVLVIQPKGKKCKLAFGPLCMDQVATSKKELELRFFMPDCPCEIPNVKNND